MDSLSDTHKDILREIVRAVRNKDISEEFLIRWEIVGASLHGGKFVRALPQLSRLALEILRQGGYIVHQPSYSKKAYLGRDTLGKMRANSNEVHTGEKCYVTPAGIRAVDSNFNPVAELMVTQPPVEITESLAKFRADFPDATKLAFVMMQFGSTTAHQGILSGIQAALEPHGMIALRADHKEYHEDVYYNILTYIYGVRFGVAAFERIQKDDFNPNVSLEVGYMFGLRKSVCLLKDRTLAALHTDLVGKLYRSFDPQDPKTTIPVELLKWMSEKGFIISH